MKRVVTVLVHRERQISHAVAGASRASGSSTLSAARTAAAHHFAAPEARVSVDIITVGDCSAVVEATLQPVRSPIAWELLRWAIGAVVMVAICAAIWWGGAK